MKIAIVNPFPNKDGIGSDMKHLYSMMRRAGIDPDDTKMFYVFSQPPHADRLENFCVKGKGAKALGIPGWPMLLKSNYVKAQYINELNRLFTELDEYEPNLILSLGIAPTWALLRQTNVKTIRGCVVEIKSSNRTYKVLPTWHPATLFKEWKMNPVFFADLKKAKAHGSSPELQRKPRQVWLEPTLDDLLQFEKRYLQDCTELSIDIETSGTQITCIGFAPSDSVAIVVPFTMEGGEYFGSYWPNATAELAALNWCRRQCLRKVKVIGQNFMYDIQHLWRNYGIPVPGTAEDTMLLHHSLQLEMKKDLGFLASIYVDERPWKVMSKRTSFEQE